MPGTDLGAGDVAMNKTKTPSHAACIIEQGERKQANEDGIWPVVIQRQHKVR